MNVNIFLYDHKTKFTNCFMDCYKSLCELFSFCDVFIEFILAVE